jgi:hypothetical protein
MLLLGSQVCGLDDEGLGRVAVGDLDLIGLALLADDLAGVTVEPRVVPTVGDAGVDLHVDLLADLELLDRSLGRGGPPVSGLVL